VRNSNAGGGAVDVVVVVGASVVVVGASVVVVGGTVVLDDVVVRPTVVVGEAVTDVSSPHAATRRVRATTVPMRFTDTSSRGTLPDTVRLDPERRRLKAEAF
jgi:hypothetical protein